MQAPEKIHEILKKAYQIEVDGYTFYSMTADKATKPAVKELFEKLAHDEVQHQAYLKEVMKNYDRAGVSAFGAKRTAYDLGEYCQKVFTDRFREQAKGASFEMGVLSVGMTLETNAVAHFSGAARQAEEAEVKAFYQFLADWEKQHFDALQGLFNSVREDFWHAGGFAAF
jgi:erythrin-vacuolar iron transport family protein